MCYDRVRDLSNAGVKRPNKLALAEVLEPHLGRLLLDLVQLNAPMRVLRKLLEAVPRARPLLYLSVRDF